LFFPKKIPFIAEASQSATFQYWRDTSLYLLTKWSWGNPNNNTTFDF